MDQHTPERFANLEAAIGDSRGFGMPVNYRSAIGLPAKSRGARYGCVSGSLAQQNYADQRVTGITPVLCSERWSTVAVCLSPSTNRAVGLNRAGVFAAGWIIVGDPKPICHLPSQQNSDEQTAWSGHCRSTVFGQGEP